LEGVHDGDLPVATFRQHGDFGLGTFHGLDGEMVQVAAIYCRPRSGDGRTTGGGRGAGGVRARPASTPAAGQRTGRAPRETPALAYAFPAGRRTESRPLGA